MIVVHECLVCPDQLNCLLFFRKILQVPQILWFSSIFVYLNPFQQWLYDFWDPSFHWGQLRDSYATITEGSNAHWCSRRKNHALRAGGENFWTEWRCKFFLFCLSLVFSFSTALQKLQKILTCFPEDKFKLNLPWSSNSKGFHPPALNAYWNYHVCNSCIWVPQLSSVWKDGSQNRTVIVGKGSNTQKCWKTKEFVGPEGFSSLWESEEQQAV